MKSLITEKQVLKNRAGITKMWKKIPKSWIDLDTYLCAMGIGSEEVLRICDGPKGPKNECGAVGCFVGWNCTYHPYQRWCKTRGLKIRSESNMSIFLGLKMGHDLFLPRTDTNIAQEQEVTQRITQMNRMSIYVDCFHALSD